MIAVVNEKLGAYVLNKCLDDYGIFLNMLDKNAIDRKARFHSHIFVYSPVAIEKKFGILDGAQPAGCLDRI